MQDPFEEAALQKLLAAQAALQQQMAELAAQTNAILQKKREREEAQRREDEARAAEERRLRMLEQPVVMTAAYLTSGNSIVAVQNDYREDVVEFLRQVPNRRWDGRYNLIPVGEWKSFTENATQLKNVTVEYRDGVRDKIDQILNKPAWVVDVTNDRRIRAQPRFDQNRHVFNRVVGAEWNYEDECWYAPVAEAWRLSVLFDEQGFKGAVLTPDVQMLMIEQLATRAKLDKLAHRLDAGERADPEYQNLPLQGNELRRFQELSAQFIDEAGGRVLLAHEMGLGKTWIAVAYAIKKNFNRTVVICPAALKPNWARIIRLLTNEEPLVLRGRVPQSWMIQNILDVNPRFIIINYDIVGAKIEMPVKDAEGNDTKDKKPVYLWAEVLNMLKPDLLVLDEAHYIKNVGSNRSKACRKLYAPHLLPMTGTPVVNRPGEYWPVLHMIDPYLFKSYERFLTDYTIDGQRARNVDQLKELLRPIMLRYTHKQVQKDLPPINRMERYYELSEDGLQNYRDILKGIYNMIDLYDVRGQGGERLNVTSILAEIMRLKQVCAADAVEHTAEMAQELYESSEEDGKKVVVFSQFKGTAYRIAQLLGDGAVCTVRKSAQDFESMDPYERMDLVTEFQKDPNIKYLVTTTGAASEGLDMTAAWYVIFNDMGWTPKEHAQAEGRAYGRLTDSHPIDSYWMIAEKPENGDPLASKETIMHWIRSLLAAKMDTFKSVVEGVEESRDDGSVAADLIKKIKEEMKKEGRAV